MNRSRLAQTFLVVIMLCLVGCGPSAGASIGLSQGDGYEVKGNEVYYRAEGRSNGLYTEVNTQLVAGADGRTFKSLAGEGYGKEVYGKDAQHVFYRGALIPDSDAATFAFFEQWYYARDARQVYYLGAVIVGADPATFELIGEDTLGRDKQDYYLQQTPLHVRDLASFKVTGKVGYKDTIWAYDRAAYYVESDGVGIPIADGSTFQVLNSAYAKDAKQVYYLKTILAEADAATFQMLDSGYAKDAKQVYHDGTVFAEADAASFQALGYNYAKDAQQVYFLTTVFAAADVQTFQVLGGGTESQWSSDGTSYAKDAKHVYCGVSVIPGADLATFEAGDSGIKDKHRYYRCTEPGTEFATETALPAK